MNLIKDLSKTGKRSHFRGSQLRQGLGCSGISPAPHVLPRRVSGLRARPHTVLHNDQLNKKPFLFQFWCVCSNSYLYIFRTPIWLMIWISFWCKLSLPVWNPHFLLLGSLFGVVVVVFSLTTFVYHDIWWCKCGLKIIIKDQGSGWRQFTFIIFLCARLYGPCHIDNLLTLSRCGYWKSCSGCSATHKPTSLYCMWFLISWILFAVTANIAFLYCLSLWGRDLRATCSSTFNHWHIARNIAKQF